VKTLHFSRLREKVDRAKRETDEGLAPKQAPPTRPNVVFMIGSKLLLEKAQKW
jgi:hypothetical protein